MERFSFGGPNDSFNKRRAADLDDRQHAHLDDRHRTRCAWAASSAATSSTRTCRKSRRPSSRSSTTSRSSSAAWRPRRTRSSGSPTSSSASTISTCSSPTTGGCRRSLTLNARRPLRVLRPARGGQRPHRQRRLRRDHEYREPGQRVHRAEERAEHRLRRDRRRDRRVARRPTTTTRSRVRTGTTSRRASGLPGRPAIGKMVVRGGYGIFYDRPSAAFINTVFSNYPFLREQEVTFPASAVPLNGAWSQQDPTFPFNQYLPNRIVRTAGADGHLSDPRRHERHARRRRHAEPGRSGDRPADARQHRRNVRVPRHRSQSAARPTCSSTTSACSGSSAANLMLEVRYVGSKGTDLLEALAFNQGYDLNAADTPDHIFERFNQAYVAAGSPNGALNAGCDGARARRWTGVWLPEHQPRRHARLQPRQRRRRAHRLRSAHADPRLQRSRSRAAQQHRTVALQLAAAQPGEAHVRRPAVQPGVHLLALEGHELRRSRAAPPAAASPTCPNTGFVVQGNQRNLDANYALSDFDRPHRFSGSLVWELPRQGRASRHSASRDSCSCSRACRTRSSPPSRSSATCRSTAISFAARAASIASVSGDRACADRSMTSARRATIRPKRRSTRACCARR